jgi:hypothetical protein
MQSGEVTWRCSATGTGQRPQAQQVDDAGESVLPPDRHLHHQWSRVALRLDARNGVEHRDRAVEGPH